MDLRKNILPKKGVEKTTKQPPKFPEGGLSTSVLVNAVKQSHHFGLWVNRFNLYTNTRINRPISEISGGGGKTSEKPNFGHLKLKERLSKSTEGGHYIYPCDERSEEAIPAFSIHHLFNIHCYCRAVARNALQATARILQNMGRGRSKKIIHNSPFIIHNSHPPASLRC